MKENEWKEFVQDINESLRLEPPYLTEDEAATIADIKNRQNGEDAFVAEDFLPESNIGLKDSTVAWLIANDVKVPENWKQKLKKQAEEVQNNNDEESNPHESNKEEKEAEVKHSGKRGKIKLALEFIKSQVEEGVTKKDLVKRLFEKFPETSQVTLRVLVNQSMKEETCRFDSIVVQGEDGILRFAESETANDEEAKEETSEENNGQEVECAPEEDENTTIEDEAEEEPEEQDSFHRFLLNGYNKEVSEYVNIQETSSKEMVVVKDAPFFFADEVLGCPCFGKASIAFVPNGKTIYPRDMVEILEIFAHRYQSQENLGNQIADAIMEVLGTDGAICQLEADNIGVTSSGIMSTPIRVKTIAKRGCFKKQEILSEFKNELN